MNSNNVVHEDGFCRIERTEAGLCVWFAGRRYEHDEADVSDAYELAAAYHTLAMLRELPAGQR